MGNAQKLNNVGIGNEESDSCFDSRVCRTVLVRCTYSLLLSRSAEAVRVMISEAGHGWP
jgi:hypothetical protein